jgi:ATP-binding cassette subfamily C (CFTR/MRP) protein 1
MSSRSFIGLLRDKTIIEEGTYDQLMAMKGEIFSLVRSTMIDSDDEGTSSLSDAPPFWMMVAATELSGLARPSEPLAVPSSSESIIVERTRLKISPFIATIIQNGGASDSEEAEQLGDLIPIRAGGHPI